MYSVSCWTPSFILVRLWPACLPTSAPARLREACSCWHGDNNSWKIETSLKLRWPYVPAQLGVSQQRSSACCSSTYSTGYCAKTRESGCRLLFEFLLLCFCWFCHSCCFLFLLYATVEVQWDHAIFTVSPLRSNRARPSHIIQGASLPCVRVEKPLHIFHVHAAGRAACEAPTDVATIGFQCKFSDRICFDNRYPNPVRCIGSSKPLRYGTVIPPARGPPLSQRSRNKLWRWPCRAVDV